MHSHAPHIFFHLIKNTELNELYSTMAIRSFALAMGGVFVPIYLYQLGHSLSSIFLFFALVSIFFLITLFPSAKLASKIGLKHAILLSVPFLIIFFLLLFSLERFSWPLWLLALFVGTHSSLFWFSYHTEFARFSTKKKRGHQVGVTKIIVAVFGVLGPLFGAIILSFLGFNVLFILVSVLLFASAFPLFMSREVREPFDLSLKGFFRGHKIKNILGYMGNGIEVRIATVLWPLFVFIFIFDQKYLSLGALVSVTFTFSLIATIIISKFSDINRRLTLKLGVIFNSIIWIVKSFLITPLQIFFSDAFYGISQTSVSIPFQALSYDKAKEAKISKIILEREMYIQIGSIIFLFIASIFADRLVELFRYGGPLASLLQFFF